MLIVDDPNKGVWGRGYTLAIVKLVIIGRGSNKLSCMSCVGLCELY